MRWWMWIWVVWAGDALAGEPLRIAAAGSLREVLPTLIEAYKVEDAAPSIESRFGASGQLAKQILRGAPDDLFLSADESFVDLLGESLDLERPSAVYAIGSLALFRPNGANIAIAQGLAGLDPAKIERLAIANPAHAPYGRAARAALRSAGLWQALQPKLAFGENVAQAAQFARSGNVDLAIIALSQAQSLADRGDYLIIEANHNDTLRHKMILLDDRAQGFFDYLISEGARSIWTDFGFLPGD